MTVVAAHADRYDSTRAAGRVLICVDFFFPSVGGTERLVEAVGTALGCLGWEVEVATRKLDPRTATEHRGMPIHELRPAEFAEDLDRVVEDGSFDAILSFADPYAWPVWGVLRGFGSAPVRTVVVPCVNPAIAGRLRQSPDALATLRGLLHQADVVVHSSVSGPDAQLAAELDLSPAYVPNATELARPDPEVAARVGIDPGERVVLCVANLVPGKGHLELLHAWGRLDVDARLVLVGGCPPEGLPHAQLLVDRAARDPRVLMAGARSAKEVAGLLERADLLVLPSRAEATPLNILEAMSRGVPWVATPASGAANEWAGGLIRPVAEMPATIAAVLDDAAVAAALGRAGQAHWASCFCVDVVADRYDRLLRGAGSLPPLSPPAGAAAVTAALDIDVAEAVAARTAAAAMALVEPAPLDARTVVVVAYVDELLTDPALLRAYAARFDDRDDATLVLYAPDLSEAAVMDLLGQVLQDAGLADDGAADLLLVAGPGSPHRVRLAARADWVLSAAPARPAFAAVPHVAAIGPSDDDAMAA